MLVLITISSENGVVFDKERVIAPSLVVAMDAVLTKVAEVYKDEKLEVSKAEIISYEDPLTIER